MKNKSTQQKKGAERKTKQPAKKTTAKSRPAPRRTKSEKSVGPAPKKPDDAAPAKASRAVKPPDAVATKEILAELRSLRSLVESPPARAVSADEALDDSVLSLRRLLSDLLERRMAAVTATLADLRASLASDEADLQRATGQLDRLLDELGVVRFDAEALDYPDPLIHAVVEERSDRSAPDGVILETLDPGLRAGAGAVLAKARVVVNRRS